MLANIWTKIREDLYHSLAIFFIIVYALAVSVIGYQSRAIKWDACLYISSARAIVENGILYAAPGLVRGPLFPLAIVGLSPVVAGDLVQAAVFVSVIASTIALVATYGLVRSLSDSRMALFTTLLVMLGRTFINNSVRLLTDMLFAALVLLALYLLVAKGLTGYKRYLLAGCCSGLAILTRNNGLLLPLFAVLGLILTNPHRLSRRRQALSLTLYLLATALIYLPWWIVEIYTSGSPLHIAQTGGPYYQELLPPCCETFYFSPSSLIQILLLDPIFFFSRYLPRWLWTGPQKWANIFVNFFGVSPFSVSVLVLPGALILFRDFLFRKSLQRRLFLFLAFFYLAWSSFFALLRDIPRYLLSLAPFFALPAMYCLLSEMIPDYKIRQRFSLKQAMVGLVLIALFIDSWQSQYVFYLQWNQEFVHQVEVSSYLPSAEKGLVGADFRSEPWYRIPHDTGMPTVSEDHRSKLPALSYMLYEDDPVPYPGLSVPLQVSSTLEAIYIKNEPVRAVLYRVLAKNELFEVTQVQASSSASSLPTDAIDGEADTSWLSDFGDTDAAQEWLTLDLGEARRVNRVWLLPLPSGQGFPPDLQIRTSLDGRDWQTVINERDYPRPRRQNPQVFSFAETEARFVKIVGLRLGKRENEEQYFMGISEVRVSRGVEKDPASTQFTLAPEVIYDPATTELDVPIINQSPITASVLVAVNEGEPWRCDLPSLFPLALAAPEEIPPGQRGHMNVLLPDLTPGPHDIYITLDPYEVTATGRETVLVDIEVPAKPDLVPEPVAVVNLIRNPGFEQGEEADGAPDEWEPDSWGGSIQAVHDEKHEGLKSLKIEQENAQGWAAGEQSDIPVGPGIQYKLGLYTKGSEGSMIVKYFAEDGEVEGNHSYEIPPAEDWQEYTRFLPLTSATTRRMSLRLELNEVGVAYYDDVRLTRSAIRNPGFEQDEDADGIPDGWLRNHWGYSAPVQEVLVNNEYHEGLRSIKVAKEDAQGWATYVQQHIHLEPNTQYEISLYTKGARGGMIVKYFAKDGALEDTFYSNNIPQARDWQRYTELLPLTSDRTGKMSLWLGMGNPGAVYYDEVELVPSTMVLVTATPTATPAPTATPTPTNTPTPILTPALHGLPESEWNTKSWDSSTQVFELDEQEKYGGSNSLKIEKTNDQGGAAYVLSVKVQPAPAYQLTGYTKGEGGEFIVAAFDSQWQQTYKGSFSIAASPTWSKQVFTFAPSGQTVKIQLYLAVTTKGVTWFDELTLSTPAP